MREVSSRRRVVPDAANRSLYFAAAWTGIGAAVVCATAAIVAVAICWLPVAGASAHTMSALHAGLLTFLAALHGGITVDATFGSFLPLGLSVIVAFAAWRAGAALADTAADHDQHDPRQLAKALLVQTGTFTLAAVIAVPFARLGTSSAPPLGVALGAFVLFGASAGAAFVRGSQLREWVLVRVPTVVARGARVSVAALAVYVGVGAVLVAASLAMHHARVEDLSRQLGGGWGSVPVLALGILAAPNAAIAGATYLAGPGFAIGTGSHVGPVGATHGLVPAFPVLGALPAGGANPVVWALIVLTPLSAGAVVTRVCLRADSWRLRFAELGAGVLATALLTALLAWLGGGSLGPGRLATWGASPWLSGAVIGGEVALTGAGGLGIAAALAWWRARRAAQVQLHLEQDDAHGEHEALPDQQDDPGAVEDAGEGAATDDQRDGAQASEPLATPAAKSGRRLAVVQRPESDDGAESGKLAG